MNNIWFIHAFHLIFLFWKDDYEYGIEEFEREWYNIALCKTCGLKMYFKL